MTYCNKPDCGFVEKKIRLEEVRSGNLTPVTVVKDQFNGVHSEGTWLAFNLNPGDLPDLTPLFWLYYNPVELPIGKGSTPDAAYESLVQQIVRYWEQQ